jgi:hypothetical protein
VTSAAGGGERCATDHDARDERLASRTLADARGAKKDELYRTGKKNPQQEEAL